MWQLLKRPKSLFIYEYMWEAVLVNEQPKGHWPWQTSGLWSLSFFLCSASKTYNLNTVLMTGTFHNLLTNSCRPRAFSTPWCTTWTWTLRPWSWAIDDALTGRGRLCDSRKVGPAALIDVLVLPEGESLRLFQQTRSGLWACPNRLMSM